MEMMEDLFLTFEWLFLTIAPCDAAERSRNIQMLLPLYIYKVNEMAMVSSIQEAQKDNLWSFNEYMMQVLEVDPGNVRPAQDSVLNPLAEAEKEAEATRQAIKRKIAQAAIADFQSRNLPAKLQINPNDPEDVKATKRKKIHAFKSKVRFEKLEVVQNKRQNAW